MTDRKALVSSLEGRNEEVVALAKGDNKASVLWLVDYKVIPSLLLSGESLEATPRQ